MQSLDAFSVVADQTRIAVAVVETMSVFDTLTPITTPVTVRTIGIVYTYRLQADTGILVADKWIIAWTTLVEAYRIGAAFEICAVHISAHPIHAALIVCTVAVVYAWIDLPSLATYTLPATGAI